MDSHITKSGENIAGLKHHALPTSLRRAKTFLKDEYLHEIETNCDEHHFFYRAKCFHCFKKTDDPHQLKLALCITTGA